MSSTNGGSKNDIFKKQTVYFVWKLNFKLIRHIKVICAMKIDDLVRGVRRGPPQSLSTFKKILAQKKLCQPQRGKKNFFFDQNFCRLRGLQSVLNNFIFHNTPCVNLLFSYSQPFLRTWYSVNLQSKGSTLWKKFSKIFDQIKNFCFCAFLMGISLKNCKTKKSMTVYFCF